MCFSANAQDFKALYHGLDSLKKIKELVHGECDGAQWTDSTSFIYKTSCSEGEKFYRVYALTSKKDEITKETYDELYKKNEPRKEATTVLISPDGKSEAILKDHNVWIGEKQLSFDGAKNDDYVEIYWSPDSKKIAAIKKHDTPMHQIPLIESSPKNQKQPILQWRNYYKPGDAIPIYTPALFDVQTGAQIAIDITPYINQYYLSFRRWREDSKAFTIEYNQRGHQVYQIIDINAQNGDATIIVDEQSPTFIDYYRATADYLKQSDELIWSSERDGWRHLYLVEASDGTLIKQLTKGEWVVREILDIDEEAGTILFYGNGKNEKEDPYNIHYYKMNLDGTNLTDLTPENGNHTALFSSDYKFFIDKYSRPDTPQKSALRSAADGSIVMCLESADISELVKTGWQYPEVFVSKGRDNETDIWGNIYFPFNYKPGKKYPVVEYIYAGPHDSFVLKDFYAYTRFSKLLKLGFIVVTIDGMGTNNRSKAFHDVCWRNLKDSGFPDRIKWITDAAAKHKSMDISEGVGIYGYSAGGQSTLAALLFFNDFYKVGVALCGCHDNRMDKIWWNEQWMGYPIGAWYSESSNVDNAYRLEGKLLLINGELDDNVDPTSTLQVVDALIKADKDFEQLYLPGYSHNLGDDYVTRKIFEFFYKNMHKSK